MPSEPAFRVTTPSDREVVMTRVLDAPRHVVFAALIDPVLVPRWLAGPPGWSMTTCAIDAREGGAYRFAWRDAGGKEMGLGGEWLEVEPPERLVATERFDEPWYPGAAVVTYTLADEDGRTRLALAVRYESAEARDIALRTPMTDGVAAAFERLEGLLATG